MSNTVLLAWDKPAALAQWQKERGKPELTRHMRTILIGGLVSSAVLFPMTAAFNHYGIKMSWGMAVYMVITQSVGIPLLSHRELRKMHVYTERHYEIRDDGVLIKSGKNQQLHPWKKIRNYQIESVPDLPAFKVLSFQPSRLDSMPPIQLGFDPTQIPEPQLQSLFAQKLSVGSPAPDLKRSQ